MFEKIKYRLRKKRVLKGAAMLDKYMPDWWKHINNGSLDIITDHSCVMGQLSAHPKIKEFAGNYQRDWSHSCRYFAHLTGIPFHRFRITRKYGFGVITRSENSDLNQLWLGQVFDRKMAHPEPGPILPNLYGTTRSAEFSVTNR